MEIKREVSQLDKQYHKMLRNNVSEFVKRMGKKLDKEGARVLDIAPQDFEGAKPYFPNAGVETLDINPDACSTYVADLCRDNSGVIPGCYFDVVVCTEVLEHTLQPFDAVREIHRILRKDGVALISTPFNFRIHGPLPDCWRFTEHGLRVLFKDFEIVELTTLEEDERFLAPIQYTTVVKKH